MGQCISKTKLYTRNELLYANRMADKYGISNRRYVSFLKSSEYELVMLNFDGLERDVVDNSYINAWNNWKRLQSWDKKYSDLDRPLLVFLSNMPTKLNSICNLCKIPKAHDEYQVECLIKFYTMQQIPDSECPVEVAINNLLDVEYYEDIVREIQERYDPNDWAISQRMNINWLRMICYIRNSTFGDMHNLTYIENLCLQQKNKVHDSLSQKIII
jgi:hypothetical protein